MTINKEKITIELEGNMEIDTFWNIIAFALDYHEQETKAGKHCMTDEEHEMAKKLAEATKIRWGIEK